MKISKVPCLVCEECGSFRVMMTDNGPECMECGVEPPTLVTLTAETEFLIQQMDQEETKDYEDF